MRGIAPQRSRAVAVIEGNCSCGAGPSRGAVPLIHARREGLSLTRADVAHPLIPLIRTPSLVWVPNLARDPSPHPAVSAFSASSPSRPAAGRRTRRAGSFSAALPAFASRVIRVRPNATPEPAGLRPATQNRSAATRQKRTRQRPTRVCGSRGLPDDGARRRSRTLPPRNETMIFESDPNSAEGDYHLRHPNPARVIAQNPETIRLRSSLLVSGTSECAVAHA